MHVSGGLRCFLQTVAGSSDVNEIRDAMMTRYMRIDTRLSGLARRRVASRETWAGASANGITASAGEQDHCVEMSLYLQLPGRLELFWR